MSQKLFRFGIQRVGGQADVLGGVVAEAAGTEVDKVVYVLQEIVLEIGILRVHVGQTSHLAGSTFHAVVPLGYWLEAVGVEQIVVAAYGIVESGKHSGVVHSGVVGQHVHDNAYAIFICAVGHLLEVVAGAQHVVADSPVGWLVIVVPLAHDRVAGLAEQSHAAVVADEACLHGRGLHVVEACVGYLFHVCGYGVEAPRPCVKNHFILGRGFPRGTYGCSSAEQEQACHQFCCLHM